MISTDLCWFFYMQPSSLTVSICWRDCFFSTVYLWPLFFFFKLDVHKYVDLCLGLQFYSIDQFICFYANAMLFLLLWLCSTSWNPGWWYLQQYLIQDYFSYAIFPFVCVCFHMKLKIVLSSFLNFFLECWWGLHCICKLLWGRMAIFTALILLIMSTGELSIFWYVCSVSFFSVLRFLLYKIFTCLVRILP